MGKKRKYKKKEKKWKFFFFVRISNGINIEENPYK